MKTIEVYMEREIRYSPDKRFLVGTIFIDNIEINFRLLIPIAKKEEIFDLLNNSMELISIEVKNIKKDIKIRKSEHSIFYDFFFRLANNFIKNRIEFRKKYSAAKSDGPAMIMFAGKVELSIQFCQLLNKYFNLKINIPRKNYRHQDNKKLNKYFQKNIVN